MNNVKIIGAGMTKFVKPGSQLPYRIMASNAVESALKDADIDKKHIQHHTICSVKSIPLF